MTTIYHNPKCGTSRTVLARIRETGVEPKIIEYLVTPPSRAEMQGLLFAMKMKPRDILRRKGTPYDDLNLDNPALTDDQILDALGAHPILMERPVVVTSKGTRVCRPADVLQEIFPD
ncbi:MAG: arsC 2 [Hyphomicrobiales bacterium]|jgi:arsenate reductase|nr:arsC 2 [Hyphomicrobiales bacterium]